jgi:thioredoxin reductase (NADPH)
MTRRIDRRSPLEDAEWFTTLPPAEQKAVRRHVIVVDIAAGRQLIREGEFDRSLFLILRGTAEVRHDGRPLAVVGPGHFVGEIGTLANLPRLADVWSVTDLTAAVATESELAELLRRSPTVSQRLLRHLAELAAAGLTGAASTPPTEDVAP